MAQLVAMHNMRQIVRNEKESIPVRGAQELLHVFVADAHIGFYRVWSPLPPFLLTESMRRPLEQRPLPR
jgi:hypothetical protein